VPDKESQPIPTAQAEIRQLIQSIHNVCGRTLKNGSVIKDESAAIGIYTQIGGDDEKTHKKLHILDAGRPREITELSVVVRELAEKKRQFTRYYFETESDRNRARSPSKRETG
jgi:hypothetical protein